MTHRTLHRIGLVAAIAAAVPVIIGGLATGTPGSGATATITARGTAGSLRGLEEKIESHANGPFDIVMQTITFQPGGHSGWHSHPGNAIVVIKSGTFTTYRGDDPTCTGRRYNAGSVYVDHGSGHVHIGRNEGTEPLELSITYLDVPIGGAFRNDAPAPGNCPF